MRQFLIRLVLCLVLGIVSTVAVAWAFALRPGSDGDEVLLKGYYGWQGGQHLWSVVLGARNGSAVLTSVPVRSAQEPAWRRRAQTDGEFRGLKLVAESEIPYWSQLLRTLSDEDIRAWSALRAPPSWDEHAFGWPFHSMVYACESDPWLRINGRLVNTPRAARLYGGIRLRPARLGVGPAEYLPLKLLWRGFLGDVLLYAGVWFAVIAGPGPCRRMARRRRGLCPNCRYNLCGDFSQGCPECGWRRGAKGPEPT